MSLVTSLFLDGNKLNSLLSLSLVARRISRHSHSSYASCHRQQAQRVLLGLGATFAVT